MKKEHRFSVSLDQESVGKVDAMAEKLKRFAPGELERKLAELKEQKQQAAERLMKKKAAEEANEPGAGQSE